MARATKIRLLLVILAALALCTAAVSVALRQVSTDALGALVEERLSGELGLEVTLDELSVALLPTPHLHVEGVRVADPSNPSASKLLSIELVDLGVALWPLLDRTLVIDALALEGANLHIEADGARRILSRLQLDALQSDEVEDPLDVVLHQLAIERMRVFYRDDRTRVEHSLLLDTVAMKSKRLDGEISIEAQGEFEGSSFSLSGQIGSLRDLLNPSDSVTVDLSGHLFEATFEAKGSVREPWPLAGIDVDFSARIPELVVGGRHLRRLGAVRFAGHLSDLDGTLAVDRLHIDTAKIDPIRLDARGRIADLLAMQGMDIEVDIDTGSLDFLTPLLEPLVDFPLPSIASLSARTTLSNYEKGLTIDGTVRAATAAEQLVLQVAGSIDDVMRSPVLDVKIEARADDLASITALLPDGPRHGAFGPVTANGRLTSVDDGLAANGIDIRMGDRSKGWVEVEGNIANVAELRDVELGLDFGAESLHHLIEVLQRELPRTPRLAGSARISDADGSLGMEHLRLHGGKDGPVEIHLEARFDDLPGRDDIEIDLGFRGDDTRLLSALTGVELPVLGPVEFQGRIKGSDERFETEKAALRLGGTRLRGSLSASFPPGTRPRIEARISSKYVQLRDLGIHPAKPAPDMPGSHPRDSAERIFGVDRDSALPFEDLRHVDLDLGLVFERVGGYAGLDLRNTRLMLHLDDGELVVSDAGANYEGSELHAELRVDARTPRPEVAIELVGESIDIGRIVSQFQEQTEYSGVASADLDLRANGATPQKLIESLSGHLSISARDGNFASRIGRELVFNLINIAFSGLRTRKVPSFGCGVADFTIEDGIATIHTLVVRSKEIRVTATGTVDLVHGLYDLRVVPDMDDQGILSIAPEVRVTGPIEDPDFRAVKRTLVTSFGRGIIGNAFKAVRTVLLPFGSRNDRGGLGEDACRS